MNNDEDVMPVLFGPHPLQDDVTRWQQEGFVFSSTVSWGLRQRHGGPCAVLAPVQAFLIAELLATGDLFDATAEQARQALVAALALILWRARSNSEDALWDKAKFSSLDTLREKIAGEDLTQPGTIVRFVVSLIRTRTVEGVIADLNFDSEPLVTRFGHGTQGLVNLCLFGKAVSHLFDGRRILAPNMEISGVPERCRIGLLSQLEVLQYQKVGNFCRCPELPIWIIASATHYSVLFAVDPTVGQLTETEAAEHRAQAEFSAFDQNESGFITTADVSKVLYRLGRHDLLDQGPNLNNLVDPDGLGVVLWSSLWQILAGRMSLTNGTWTCQACTFVNEGPTKSCEVCETQRPVFETEFPVGQLSVAPDQFILYHYNGIENHSGAQSHVTEISVTLFDAEGIPQGQSAERGLREVIQTRWPSAIIEYNGDADPHIT